MDKENFGGLKIEDFPFDHKLLARPGQSLEQHLSSVRKALDQISFKIPFFSIPSEGILLENEQINLPKWMVMDLLKILVATHDFGKISPYFQLKIRKVKIKDKEPLSYHTKTSAYFAYLLLDEYFETTSTKIQKPAQDLFKTLIPYSILNHHTPKLKTTFLDTPELISETLVTLALIKDYVQPHQFDIEIPGTQPKHGDLVEFLSSTIDLNLNDEKDLNDKIDDLNHVVIRNALKRLFELTDISVDLKAPEIPDWEDAAADEFYDLMDELERLWEKTSSYPVFMPYFLFLHSILGDLDEWDARTFQPNSFNHTSKFDWNHQFPIPFSSVDTYRKNKFTGKPAGLMAKIINVRNELFSLTNSLKIAPASQAYILEAPTGSAKTLAMLNLACRIAEQKEKRIGKAPHIIYALPFISITDQVGEVIADLVKASGGDPDESLIVHHMLADFPSYIFEPEFDEEKDEIIVGRASVSTRLWHSPFIATTFVSLMDIIFSGIKRAILRFHRLVGSVIILDEIQSLPPKYWEILSRMVNYLIRYMDVDFIIGSATNPKPLSQHVQQTITPQLPQNLLRTINRYHLIIHTESETIDSALQRIIPEIRQLENRQVLIVVNTKRSCRTIYNALMNEFPDEEVYLLSTWLRPIDRKASIEIVRQRLASGQPVILVATQVVEAGVDLDFRTVYRDFAPIDSIVQVAGRCNRNYRYESGIIQILNLVNQKGRSYASYIYDTVSLEATQELLTAEMNELDVRESV
ncbi:MAG: CRISPR-associated helicase Cas3', partial [Methanobacteriota archaeon]